MKPELMPEDFMREAIKLSIENVTVRGGGPFGCVIVKDGLIIGRGYNRVTATCDPTAHAEVTAIRDACKALKDFQLTDCDLYTTCEPCPMCLGAIYWARPRAVYFAATKEDAATAGFDDAFIYHEISLALQNRKLLFTPLLRTEALQGFKAWRDLTDKILY